MDDGPKIPHPAVAPTEQPEPLERELCDICESDQLSWRKCKLMCLNCGTILKSCADL